MEKLDFKAFLDSHPGGNVDEKIAFMQETIQRHTEEDGMNFLRVLLFRDMCKQTAFQEKSLSVLSEIVSEILRRKHPILSLEELLPFCFALIKLHEAKAVDLTGEGIQLILRRNISNVLKYFAHEKFSFLIPRDGQGRPPPPGPKQHAFPKHAAVERRREQNRALPGYTPGWLAAEYAANHSI